MATVSDQHEQHSRITLVNRFSHAMTFVVEPWGSVFSMEPAAVFEIVSQGPPSNSLELVLNAASIEVWGGPVH